MNSITQEQQISLDGFTVQRDALVKEISELTPIRDSLRKEISITTGDLTILHQEIANNELIAKQSNILTTETVTNNKNSIVISKIELSNLEDTKQKASKELDTIIGQLDTAGDSITKTMSSVNVTLEEARLIRNEIHSIMGDISVFSNSVKDESQKLINLVKEFHTLLLDEDRKNKEIRLELDTRETQLTHRENAINATYGEILEIMKDKSINLSKLNEK